MGSGILGTGITALNAAQAGMLTTSHNISNAATPGYHRQETVQRAAIAQFTGAGYIGKGVEVTDIRRAYDRFLAAQVVSAQSQSSQLDSYYAHIKQLDDMLADPTAGLSPALQAFFDASSAVANSPSSIPARQSMLSSAQSLVSRFHAMQQRYDEIRTGLDDEIRTSVTNINSYAQQIASLNRAIVTAQGGSTGQPNDMLDQRDQLLLQLNKEIGATLVKQDDGSYNVFIGNGQALVVGGSSFALTVGYDLTGPTRLAVGYSASGGTAWLPDSSLQGGALGGYIDFRSGTLDSAQNALGRIALGLAQTFNDQHARGQDLNGGLGTAFFDEPTPAVFGIGGGNASPVSVTVDAADLTASDYRLSFSSGVYTLTRLSDGVTASTNVLPSSASPLAIAGDGVSIAIASPPGLAAGDTFLIQPTRNAARDVGVRIGETRLIAAAAPIRTAFDPNNTGSGRITAGSVTGTLPGANPQPTVVVVFTGSDQYELRAGTAAGAVLASSPVGYKSGDDITFNGWTVQITGTPAPGDVFTIGPNGTSAADYGITDNRNALALAQLGTANTLISRGASYQGAYAQIVSEVGNKTRELEVTCEAQANLLAQTVSSEQAIAGVNLDEEAANLLRYQQAYQAAARVLQIASTLFDSVLEIGR
jgi:flagellar hook-associated protein 1 FlgK